LKNDRFRRRNDREGYRHHRERRDKPFRRAGSRFQRPAYRGKPQARPTPIGDKCNPLCSLFYCTQRALVISNKPYRGKYIKAAFCRLTGSECTGAECRYASCRINALLPDGRCAKALEKRQHIRSDEELFKEMQSIEDIDEESFL